MNRDREARVFAVFGDTHDYDYGNQAGLAVFASHEEAERVVGELERAKTPAARKAILSGAEDFTNFSSFEVPAFGLALSVGGGVEEALREMVKASNDYRLAIDAADGAGLDAYGRLAVAEERGRQALSPRSADGVEP